jgi:uncharacterized protein YutE (UPF0331/DUF86 family)
MADDVILNKAEIIEKCLSRINEEYENNPNNLRKNQTKQDAILLNLERACQASIDMAMRLIKLKRLGLPKDSRDSFELLNRADIDQELMEKMFGLVGFRNTAIHNYKKLDLDIVEAIINCHLEDFRKLASTLIKSK